MPAEFGIHFLPHMKNIPKQTKLHLNEIGLTNIEFYQKTNLIEAASNLLKFAIFRLFANTGVRVNVTAKL